MSAGWQDLRGFTAVVTGGGGGIGRALVLELAGRGARVVAADLIGDDVAETAALGPAGSVLPVTADVSVAGEVQALADTAFDRLGHVDLLCNNAGVWLKRSTTEAVPADWNWVLEVNLWGVVHALDAFLPAMLDSGRPGHVVNVASMMGLIPSRRSSPYTSSKYAVVGLTEALRHELAGTPISVTLVCPGAVRTAIGTSERLRPADQRPAEVRPPAPAASGPKLSPAREPDGVARLILSAVADGTFYVFTDTAARPAVEDRHRELMQGFDWLEQQESYD